MSAKALAASSFEPALEPKVATHDQPAEGPAKEIEFREDLWREYRLEAINAGFSIAEASQYANALSQEMGLAVGVSEAAPAGRGWFYQSRLGTVNRTLTSGLIRFTRRERSRTTRVPIFAFGSRPWNGGGRS